MSEPNEFQLKSWLAIYFAEDRRLRRERTCACCGTKSASSTMMYPPFYGEPLCEECGNTPPGVITGGIRRRREEAKAAYAALARPCNMSTPAQCALVQQGTETCMM